MKLIIDIPSIIYNDAKENRGYISVGKMEIAWKAIADGKPLKQEPILDKIRAEIADEKIDFDLDIGQEIHYNRAIDDVLAIIDRYRKGEQE